MAPLIPSSISKTLIALIKNLPASFESLWVAYSGGLDSHLLLHTLTQLREQTSPTWQLRAVHIHHGLQKEADHWAQHCQHICQTLGIPCEIIRVKVRIASRESLEANARTARYQAIAQLLNSNDVVLTGQHADDQAETVLLQLLRGAGVPGLAAMPQISRLEPGWLIRPFLNYTRAELYDYAQKANLQWIEDASNADTRFDRNFIRHQIMPRLQQRWPSVNHILARVARHQAEADELIHTLAETDWRDCEQEGQLRLPALSALNPARQRHVLRFWIKQSGLPLPSSVQLEEILNQFLTAKADRQPLVSWPGAEVRRYHHQLFAIKPLPPVPKASDTLTWQLPESLPLPWGELRATEVAGQGLALTAGTRLQVRFRQGGETFRWQGHQRAVKKLLQAAELPPWQRAFIPLIYLENTLLALPQIGIADGFVARNGEKGWAIQWDL
jgi:tRNA(Ile)-lysidine synthase